MNDLLVFAHIGDLHITTAKEQNYIDFLSILSQIEVQCASNLDFVFLPGDNADNGLPEQYKLVATGLKMLSAPVHILAGDHDMEQGGLLNFYTTLPTVATPYAWTKNGVRCIFLDVCGPGKGGPDFRLGESQLSWLENEFAHARKFNETLALFMHVYPDDLKDETEKIKLNRLLATYPVALVNMGHTHYNELGNDGQTIFSATRSTGQIEEGPVGFSLVTINNGIVSWRFKPLADAFPFVVITAPADYRLHRHPNQIVSSGKMEVAAIVFGMRPVQRVACQIQGGSWIPMHLANDGRTWLTLIDMASDQPIALTVEAVDSSGRPGRHTIVPASSSHTLIKRVQPGSDASSIGAWPENGIYGTQLGPNRNARPNKNHPVIPN